MIVNLLAESCGSCIDRLALLFGFQLNRSLYGKYELPLQSRTFRNDRTEAISASAIRGPLSAGDAPGAPLMSAASPLAAAPLPARFTHGLGVLQPRDPLKSYTPPNFKKLFIEQEQIGHAP
jgi:hypothetical protein